MTFTGSVASRIMSPRGWATGFAGILHQYAEGLVAFEFTTGATPKPNTLLFVGGLSDGIGTTPYIPDLANALEHSSWSLLQPNLSSSHSGWGVESLGQDVEEMAECIRYIQSKKNHGKIAIMGHSTGSQDVLHYLYSSAKSAKDENESSLRPAVDGAIMQAAVSDREAMRNVLEEGSSRQTPEEAQKTFATLLDLARKSASDKSGFDVLLPLDHTAALGYGDETAVSGRRFLSLISPDSPAKPAEDDLFSSDLEFDKTFGVVSTNGLLRGTLLVLLSGEDGSYPENVDKEALLRKWKNAANGGDKHRVWNDEFSGVIPGASHGLGGRDEELPRQDLTRRVTGYLATL